MSVSTRRIGPVDLAAQHRALAGEIEAAVLRVLRSGRYVLGEEVAAFEAELARWFGARHVVTCASGSDALTLALLALGIRPGDEVIVPAFTIAIDAEVVALLGGVPVFVDVDAATGAIDPSRVAAAITPRTRAVIAVHLYGVPTDVAAIRAACGAIPVIEDAAQALGSRLGERACGTLGDFGCFSFFPTKNLGAAGDGGALVVGDDARAKQLRALRNHGCTARYVHDAVGLNSRLDELQAAILRVKLRHVAGAQARRAELAARYDAALAPLGLAAPAVPGGRTTNFHQYTIRHPRRDALRDHLARVGIDAAVHYPHAVFQHAPYRGSHADEDFPVAVRLAAEVLSLPLHAELADEDVERVVAAVRAFE
ncbi:MAG TPA: DegT/DnrJ/EryC1/StrS family aminotransferase [Kofleriaceae bacterium]|nr:DegT/DnrJ/EryC1/StrS family aminotransferase [Kofleriaceae bacterium]